MCKGIIDSPFVFIHYTLLVVLLLMLIHIVAFIVWLSYIFVLVAYVQALPFPFWSRAVSAAPCT